MPAQNNDSQPNAWWTTLRHGGVLVSPIVLEEKLPEGPAASSEYDVDRLRRAFTQFQRDPERELGAWLDTAFETFLGHTTPNWQKGQNVGDRFRHTEASGAIRKPSRVLLNALKEHEPRFLVLIDKDRLLKDDKTPGQIGVHGGRRTYGQFLALLRATNVKLGILTNGFQFRLIYAGLDTEAWTEWSASAWFEGGDGRRALDGFRSLVGVERIPPDTASSEHALLDMVEDSRKRQADLSHVMGTQVREAVEILLNSLDNTLASATPQEREALLAPLRRLNLQRQSELDALYQAAIRVVMRLVVTAYAESRGLFPMEQGPYLQSYSLEMLFRRLQEAKVEEGIEVLHQQEGAWPTIVSQARLVYHGSNTERLPNSPYGGLQMVAYGGRLFQPPPDDTTDAVLAALSILESSSVRVSDATVHAMLELLKIGRFKSGRGKPLKGPVDFSDLRTEYIGMMYEGLLDYQLREARPEDGGIVFLNLGEQPALPLRVLVPKEHTAESDARLKKLITELNKRTKGKSADAADDEEADDEAADDDYEATPEETEVSLDDAEEAATEPDATLAETDESVKEQFEAEVMAWALRAVRLNPTIFLHLKARKEKDPTIKRKAEEAAARRLILKKVPPGGTYLVRWSGTRKGTGTFYTKPALAVPTVNRTLEPLAYDQREDGTKVPKTPEEILSLKVCDPAMGSGSFLVAALRYLTRALQESFEHHVFQKPGGQAQPVTVMGTRAEGLYRDRLVPIRLVAAEWRGEGPDPNARMESELKRAVVEHSIYGVDLNPLAVELGKLALWVETMDPQLTFAFLDHKVKCGNSLIGAWQVQAEHYPLGAWERELGDGKSNPRTKRLQRIRKEIIVPEMQQYLDQFDLVHGEHKARRKASRSVPQILPGQKTLGFDDARQPERKEQPAPGVRRRLHISLSSPAWDASPEEVAEYTRDVYAKMHASLDATEQEEEYRKLLSNAGYQRQKFLLDMWCAAWFWPIRAPETAALDAEPILTPKDYYAEREKPGALPDAARRIIEQVADQQRFFHWEVEYPDVFDVGSGRFGFDVMVGNPPWETAKPLDNEFFTQYDPAYRTYGKQEGERRQKELFAANAAIREDLWSYQEGYKSQSNFIYYSHALDKPRLSARASEKWLALTRQSRELVAGVATPFAYQGSGDLNLYKLFLERALAQTRRGGRVGLILPSGIYGDLGTRELRLQLYDHNSIEWLFSFENRRKIFDIDSRYKFAAVILSRGGATPAFRARFYVHEVSEWTSADVRALTISRETIRRMSPEAGTLVEVTSERDLAILDRAYACSRLLGENASPEISVGREYHLTDDSDKIRPVQKWIEEGYVRRGAKWVNSLGDTLVPVYGGIMVHQFDALYKSYEPASGEWVPQAHDAKRMMPELLMREREFLDSDKASKQPKVAFRDIARATDSRTMLAAIIPGLPSGHSVTTVKADLTADQLLMLCGVLNSYVFDFALRFRVAGTHLSAFYLEEMPLPKSIFTGRNEELIRIVARLNLHPALAEYDLPPPPGCDYAIGETERSDLLLRLNQIVAEMYGLVDDDIRYILRADNADPRALNKDRLSEEHLARLSPT